MISGLLLGLLCAKAQAPVAAFSANPTAGCGPLSVKFSDQSSNSPSVWAWSFGDGQISSSQNPTVTYKNPGTYNVRLIVRNSSGSNVVEKDGYITVYPFPSPGLSSNLNVACTPATVQFTDMSAPGAGSLTNWLWAFGDGANSTAQNPSHIYTQTGYYNVSLQVTNSNGCSNNITEYRYIRVINGVQPNFVFNQSSATCSAPYTGQLLNQSAGPGNLTYNWTIANGAAPASSADTSPVVTFPANGQYTVNLSVSSSLGCASSIQQTLNLTGNTATIKAPATACVNTPVTFTDGSAPLPPSATWAFSDGTNATGDSVTRTFPATGTYTVNLTNQYANCIASGTATVNVVNPPTADFSASPTAACRPPLTVQFTDQTTSIPAGTITGWLWDFGDGSTSTQQNPTHTYTTAGNFNVTLSAMGPGSCPNTLTKNAFVNIQPPTVTIAGILGACVATTSSFNVISPRATVNAPDGVQSYSWSAPGSNEGNSTAAGPSFTYPNTGNYTISLTITTKGGCTVSASTPVQIGTPLSPSFTTSPGATVCNSQTLTFSSTTPGNPQSYLWTFGDHSGNQGTGPVVTYQYAFYGGHEVTLTVYNNGCPQADSQLVTIDPPFARFGYALANPNCTNRSQIQFSDSSYTANTPALIGIYGPITWSWDFGDGSTSNAQNPVHTYPAPTATPVPYTVTLTVTQGSCSSSTRQTVTIGNIAPSFTPPAGTAECVNKQFVLLSTSTPASLITTYYWSADGVPISPPMTVPNWGWKFNTNGPHTITLTPVDIYGCVEQTVTNTIQIAGPVPQFTENPLAGGCKNATVAFADQTASDPNTATITGWSWNFGDGATSILQNPQHVYADTGTFNVLLTATDLNQCTDTISHIVQITSPIANFFPPDSFYCPNAIETFIDSSQGYGLHDTWTFGDGPATSATGTHSYTANGTYNVTLSVTDKNNCTSTTTKPILIQTPVAAFNIYDSTAICLPLQTIFAAHGKYYDTLYWNFGDGTTSTLDSTSHFYNNFGLDTAKLFVGGPGGCLDSASYRVRISNPTTTTLNYGPPLSACDSIPVQFNIGAPPYSLFTLNFGDNTADSSQNTTLFHMYHNPSQYFPNLVLTDETGCIYFDGNTKTVTVLGATPYFNVNKGTFCDSGTVIFNDYTISNDGFASETYLFGDGSMVQSPPGGAGSFNTSHLYGQPGNWIATLQIVTTDNCRESYSDTIHIYPTPHPVITIPPITCTGPIQFQGNISPLLADPITWSWNFGNGQTSKEQNPTVPMAPGTYTVTLDASVPFGCIDSASSTIIINPSPLIKGPNELTVPLGIPVTIPFTYSSDVVSYNWTPTANLSCTDCANPVATVILPTTYTVTVTDANTCSASDTILIKTVCNDKNYWFPNTFSPNGDGVNDYFYPRGTSLYNIQSLTIFNRWGQQVFARMNFPANQQNMGWDGTFGGKPAPADAYVYIAEVICENAQVITISGSVTLIR